MNQLNLFLNPVTGYVQALFGTRLAAFRDARSRGDAGASAIELAVITGILVMIALAVVGVVMHIVNTRCQDMINDSQTGAANNCPTAGG